MGLEETEDRNDCADEAQQQFNLPTSLLMLKKENLVSLGHVIRMDEKKRCLRKYPKIPQKVEGKHKGRQ
jgi:hypothetical protein